MDRRLVTETARQEYRVGLAYLRFDRNKAEQHLRSCLSGFRGLFRPNHPNIGMALLGLGRVLGSDEAKLTLADAIQIFRADAARPLRLAKALESLGDALSGYNAQEDSYFTDPPVSNEELQTDLLEAIECYEEAQNILEAKLIPWGVELVRVNRSMARCYARLGNAESASRCSHNMDYVLRQIADLTESLGHIVSTIVGHDVAFSSPNTVAMFRMFSRSIDRSKLRVATRTASADASSGGDDLADVPDPTS